MATENVNIGINVVGTVAATTNLGRVQNSVTQMEKSVLSLNKAFDQMKGAFTIGAFTAVVTKINQYALGIQQASAATGVAMDTVSGFASAVAQAGGNANMATGDVIDFVAGLDAAKQGASGAQIDLAKVGISLKDLGKLSNQDLFKKTVDGLAKIEDASTRNRLALALLGKSFKDVDIRAVAGNMGGGADVGSIRAAAAAQTNMNKIWEDTKNALIEVSKGLNTFIAQIKLTKDDIKDLIYIVLSLASAFAGLKYVIPVLIGISETLVAFATGAATAAATVTVLTGKLGAAIAVVGEAWAIFRAASGAMAIAALSTVITAVAAIVLRIVAIGAAIWGVGKILKAVFDITFIDDFFNYMFGKFGQAVDWAGKLWREMWGKKGPATSPEDDARELSKFDRQAAAIKEQVRITNQVVDAQRAVRLAIDQTIAAYARTHALQTDSLKFANDMIGKSDEEKNKLTALETLRLGYMQQKYDLEKQYNDLKAAAAVGTAEEQAKFAAFAAQYKDAQSRITAGYDYQKVVVNDLLEKGEGLTRIEANRVAMLQRGADLMAQQEATMEAMKSARTTMQTQLIDVQFAAAQTGKNPLQQQMAQINEDARKAALEASRTFAAAFTDTGDGLTPERMAELQNGLDEIAAGYRAIADAQMANVEAGRTWQAGWKDAFDKYLDNATNAATKAGEVFGSITSNMNSAIDTFVTKGTFSFKSFATSIIQDMLKIEMKAQASSVLKALFAGGSGILSTIFGGGQYAAGSYAGMVGAGTFPAMAGGGQPVPNKATLVGEKGPELFVPRSAGTVIPNDKMGGSSQPVINNNNTYNTYQVSAIDAKSVAQLFAENRKTLLGTVRMAEREQPYAR
jgi:lambda family phage tail tape measure protein